ncbi:hypothetical protein LINPERHAP1_LOCUS15865 [Linum perenne]
MNHMICTLCMIFSPCDVIGTYEEKTHGNVTTIDLIEVAFGTQNHGKVAGLGGGVKPKDINGKSSKSDELLAKLRQVEEEKASLQKCFEDNEVVARAEIERQNKSYR